MDTHKGGLQVVLDPGICEIYPLTLTLNTHKDVKGEPLQRAYTQRLRAKVRI